MPTSKWFRFEGKEFWSNKKAQSLKEAFAKSLEKWHWLSKGFDCGTEDIETCGLCDLYWDDGCENCPVFKVTAIGNCEATPFRDWKNSNSKNHKSIAQREYRFLEYLKGEFLK